MTRTVIVHTVIAADFEMPDATLQSIEGRVLGTTAGEWSNMFYEAEIKKVTTDDALGSRHEIASLYANPNAINDARFIAHAHSDMRALIAEVKRLRNAVKFTMPQWY
jgi:hypothetical protein